MGSDVLTGGGEVDDLEVVRVSGVGCFRRRGLSETTPDTTLDGVKTQGSCRTNSSKHPPKALR